MDEMVTGIQLWASEENASGFSESQRVTQRYRDSKQAKIGYHLLFRGILASDWSERQQLYLININGAVRGTEADTWSSKVTTWLVNEAHTIWKARNEELHRPTSPDNSHIARAALELQERVRELYEQKDNVNYEDRDLFEITLEARLQQSVSIMRAWVESTSKTLGICIEDFVAATERGNSDIRDYIPIKARATRMTLPATQAVKPIRQDIREPSETHTLLDTSSGTSSSSSSNNKHSSVRSSSRASTTMQKIRAAFNKAVGKPRRRRKAKTPMTPRPSQDKETAKNREQHSDTETETSDSDQENKEPPIARRFTPKPKPKKQSTLTSFNFGIGKEATHQTPKASEKDIDTTKQNQQQWSSPQPARHRRREVSTGSRVWDAERTDREGGGGPARVAKFRDKSTQQLGSAADFTPVVL
jgi:hypothetical protein